MKATRINEQWESAASGYFVVGLRRYYLISVVEDYLRMLEIRHIYWSPCHLQSNGKLERLHETLRARLNLLVFTSPETLGAATAEFIEFYNHRRYHEGIGTAMPGGRELLSGLTLHRWCPKLKSSD